MWVLVFNLWPHIKKKGAREIAHSIECTFYQDMSTWPHTWECHIRKSIMSGVARLWGALSLSFIWGKKKKRKRKWKEKRRKLKKGEGEGREGRMNEWMDGWIHHEQWNWVDLTSLKNPCGVGGKLEDSQYAEQVKLIF